MSSPMRRPDLVVEEVSDGLVVLDDQRGIAHALNPSAAAVFELLDGTRGLDEIAALLSEWTGVPKTRIEIDVRTTIDELRTKGLLRE